MNRKILTVLLFAAIGGLLLTAPALAQGMGPGHGNKPCDHAFWRHPEMVKALNLTNDQIDRLDKIEIDAARSFIDLNAAEKKAELDLGVLMREPRLDEKKAKPAVDALLNAKRQILYKHIETRAAATAVLSDEQVKKLKELLPFGPECRHGDGPDGRHEHEPM